MHLIYIDDSYRSGFHCFSGVAIPAESWRESFDAVKAWRRQLKSDHGIYVSKELHAVDFCAGRGRISEVPIGKWERCRIFGKGLDLIASLRDVRIFNVCSPHSNQQAFERLLTRIDRTLDTWKSRAVVICDEGDQAGYTRLARRMHAHNPIPSKFGAWPDGKPAKNIPIDRILDDLVFKDSRKSYFVQLADFCAYALLQKEDPLPARAKYGLDQAYTRIAPVYVKETSTKDEYGIIR